MVFSPSDFSTLHHEPVVVGGRLGYQFSDQWSAGGQFSNYSIGSSTTPSQDVTLQPITAWIQRDFIGTRLWTPYLLASAGVTRNTLDQFSAQESDTGWTAGLAFGLNWRVSEMSDLSLEIGARQFSQATLDHGALRLIDAALILRFYVPESWVPVKSDVDISAAELELPITTEELDKEIDPGLLAQVELARIQQEIGAGKYPPISFDAGTARLQTTSFEALDTIGAILRRYPDVAVRIFGFVEESYGGEAAEALALARSEVVRTYVVQNFHLNEARLAVLGERPLPPPEQGAPPPRRSRRIEFEPQLATP
jgi:outer membrane protein OmpA-like peptidoglycan-associated protein